MELDLSTIIGELERAAEERGDIRLSGRILDLAVVGLVLSLKPQAGEEQRCSTKF